ncbi:hypothetical protein OSB04_008353 [Centaurea solstitialis]|uniref:Uncharacterized protein n=1 Tax=Centaurea solstitialis TaxID=347529 RepID=A0AA38TU61_9ASTR|nr:hypothetical protein OSB04_008353 [Centaurea solstitialis]
MASSNRHWPSMFKSKPTYNTHQDHQWQSQGSNHPLSSVSRRSSPYSSGCDERTPEPKPRWNPKPEQIRILESIFNSGMVNPPRDEIRKIRARLQEKSRSKNKNRHLQKSQNHQTGLVTKAATASSSSSSDKSSSKSIEFLLNSPTASVNQQPQAYIGGSGGGAGSHHHHHGGFFQEPFYFPVVQQPPPAPTTASFTHEFSFPELTTMINQENHHGTTDDPTIVSSSEILLTDLMMNHQYEIPTRDSKTKDAEDENMMRMLSHSTTTTPLAPPTSMVPPPPTTTTFAPSTINDIQGGGVEEGGRGKVIVFINEVPFEVAVGPFNVKEAFGGDAVLVDPTGQTVVTNEWGITLQSLQHGAFYYLARSFTHDHATTVI